MVVAGNESRARPPRGPPSDSDASESGDRICGETVHTDPPGFDLSHEAKISNRRLERGRALDIKLGPIPARYPGWMPPVSHVHTHAHMGADVVLRRRKFQSDETSRPFPGRSRIILGLLNAGGPFKRFFTRKISFPFPQREEARSWKTRRASTSIASPLNSPHLSPEISITRAPPVLSLQLVQMSSRRKPR